MDSELQRRRVAASFAIAKIGHDPFGGHLAYQIQSLGRLDRRLRDEDRETGELFDKNDEHEPSLGAFGLLQHEYTPSPVPVTLPPR